MDTLGTYVCLVFAARNTEYALHFRASNDFSCVTLGVTSETARLFNQFKYAADYGSGNDKCSQGKTD